MMISLSALAVLLPLVSASPLLDKRQAKSCDRYGNITLGSYSLLTDLWGISNPPNGWQCSTLESVNNDVVTWSTEWDWSGTSIQSFSNIQLNEGINQQLGAISSMPSSWSWSLNDDGTVVADVAYDFFTSYSAGGSNANEIMVWLANFNAGPISTSYGSDGQPVPIASNVGLGAYTWNLYSGSNGNNPVYSFLPASGNINDFSGDMYAFFNYLIDCGYIGASQYLKTAQAGTEATSGSAKLDTSAYSLSIY